MVSTADGTLMPAWIPFGLDVLDGAPMAGVVVNAAYSSTAVTVADIVAAEVGPDRPPRTGAAFRTAVEWKLMLDGTTPTDLTGVASRTGVYWYYDDPGAATDADRLLVAFGPDPGGATPSYVPTWPDGIAAITIDAGPSIPDPSDAPDGYILTVSGGVYVLTAP